MEQDRIHIKLARRTPEERQADETRRLDPFMRALKAIHTAATPETMNVEDLEKQRKGQELLGRLVAPMEGMSWEPFELDGMNCAWVRPHRGHDRRRAILYCHGGGYTSGNLGYSRILASKLANVTGWQVLSFEYRLAPEHPYPAAVEDAVKAWDYLMYQGYGARDVVVAGDSAGGNLALVLTHLLKEAGRRLPRALILLSPCWYKKAISKFDPAWFVVDRNAPRSRPMHSIAPPAFCPSSMPSPVEPGAQLNLKSAY